LRSFLEFYIPLALTSLLSFLVQPIGSASLSRMPLAIESLATWSVVNGLAFMFRSLGIAYNEVVVALLDEPHSSFSLRRFTHWLIVSTTSLFFIMAATPLSTIWFHQVSGLSLELTRLAVNGLWLVLPTTALMTMQSWFQGAILYGRKTRGITESVALFLIVCTVLFLAGVAWQGAPGLYIGAGVFTIAMLVQTIWLWRSSRPVMAQIAARDAASPR
jgi:hypothetical protein